MVENNKKLKLSSLAIKVPSTRGLHTRVIEDDVLYILRSTNISDGSFYYRDSIIGRAIVTEVIYSSSSDDKSKRELSFDEYIKSGRPERISQE